MPSTDHSIVTNDDSPRLPLASPRLSQATPPVNYTTNDSSRQQARVEPRLSAGEFAMHARSNESQEASQSGRASPNRHSKNINVPEDPPPGYTDSLQRRMENSNNSSHPPPPPLSPGKKLLRGIRSLWMTREMETFDHDKEALLKTTLRELVIYVIYLVGLCIISFAMKNSSQYYFTKVLSDLFINSSSPGTNSFRQSKSVVQVWKYLEGPFMNAVYWDKWYNNDRVTDDDRGFILYENKLLGVPRLRTVRVKNTSCEVHPDFSQDIKECFSEYASYAESSSAFGPAAATPIGVNDTWPPRYKSHRSAWTFASAASLGGTSATPGILSTYGGGGFFQDLSKIKAETAAILADLKSHSWLDRATRALFIDLTVYNANINLFCQIRLTAEFPATGGVATSSTFRTVSLLRLESSLEYFVTACQIMFCIFVVYYLVEEALEIREQGWAYFKLITSWMDLAVVALGIVVVGLYAHVVVSADRLLADLLEDSKEFPDFDYLGFYSTAFYKALAILVFISWIKIFKYVSFSKTMSQLSLTLTKCAKDLAGFTLMFFIVFFAFAQLAYLIFGSQVKEFSTFKDCVFTQLRIILGDFSYGRIEAAHRVLGPIYFFFYIFVMFFVLVNMFLAIINDSYADVKADLGTRQSDFDVAEYLQRGYNKILEKLDGRRDKLSDIQKVVGDTTDHLRDADGRTDLVELRKELKSRGYADRDIDSVLAKYDLDGDKALSREERRRMIVDLEGEKADIEAEMVKAAAAQRRQQQRALQAAAVGFKSAAAARTRPRPRLSVDNDSDDSEDEDDSNDKSRGGEANGVSYENFQVLTRRVDRMEHSIGSIVSKIDAVLLKLEGIEKVKARRRETMGKLLENMQGGGDSGVGGEMIMRKLGSTGSLAAEEALRREQMEKLVREELERWDSSESTTGGEDPAPRTAPSNVVGKAFGGVSGGGGRVTSQAPSPMSGSNGTRPGSATSLSSMSGRV